MTTTVTFIVCSNTSPGEGIAVEANYNGSSYLKSVASLSYSGPGTCTGGSGSLFNVSITLPSDASNPSFQSYATSTYGNANTGITGTFSGFNYFTGTLLAVKFESIAADLNKQDQVIIKWHVADEEYHEKYQINRSADGITWETLGKVDGLSERGNKKSYSFLDKSPLQGVNYYRVVHYDLLGEITYSKIITLNVNFTDFTIESFPSPLMADSDLKIIAKIAQEGMYNIILNDVSGKIIYRELLKLGTGRNTITISSSLSKGFYTLSLLHAKDGKHKTLKIVAQ
jgi:hypothetical protein